jgi:plastocyanin
MQRRPAVTRFVASIAAMCAALVHAGPAAAEQLTSKTPNIESPRTVPVGQLDFPFTHRFSVAKTKVSNSPTFQLSTGLTPSTSAAFRWASASRLVDRKDPANAFHSLLEPVNEFELSVKQAILSRSTDMPLDLSALLGYNTSANSGDLALVTGVPLGPLTLLGTGKVFTNGYGAGGYAASAGAGLLLNLTKYFQLQADINGVVYAQNDPQVYLSSNTPALSLGIGFEIPYSPHTALLYVTNGDTHSLQGTGRGAPPNFASNKALLTTPGNRNMLGEVLDQLRFGFEFNIPFSSATRWIHIFAPPAPPPETPPEPAPQSETPSHGGHMTMSAPSSEPAEAPATQSAEATAVPKAPPTPAAPLPEKAITITNFAFSPATITVPAGTTVRWINKDTVVHTSTSDKPGWDSGIINPGASYTRRFDKPGTYAYHCTPHPFMVGKVVVQ